MLVTCHVSKSSVFQVSQSILTELPRVMVILQDFGSIYGNLQTCSTIFIFFNINFVFEKSFRGDAFCVEGSSNGSALQQLSHDILNLMVRGDWCETLSFINAPSTSTSSFTASEACKKMEQWTSFILRQLAVS
jgi:hypothetical protein